jgi:integrase
MGGRAPLQPGQAGTTTFSVRGTKVRAKAKVRLFDGSYAWVSASGDNEKSARIACERAVEGRLGSALGDASLGPDTLLGVAARQFIDQCRIEQTWPRPPRKAQTVDRYEKSYKNWIHPYLGKLRLRELSTGACQRWVNQITQVNLSRTGPVRSVEHAVVVMPLICARAVQHGAIATNPMLGVGRPRGEKKAPRALDVETVGRLRAAVRLYEIDRKGKQGPGPKGDLPCLVDLLLGTGLRIGEALALRWQDVLVPAENGRYAVDVSATMSFVDGVGEIRQNTPKTASSDRVVILPPFVVEALRGYRPEDAGPGDFVFPAQRRRKKGSHELSEPKPRPGTNVRASLRAALALHGLDDAGIHPHRLRKTAATFVARSRSLAEAGALLGHKVASGVTVDHYVERLRTAPDVSDVLQAMIEASERLVPLPVAASLR